MSKLSQRERILLVLFFGILFFYVVYQYWYEPFVNQNRKLTAERDSLQVQWQDIQGNLGTESKLKQDVEKLKIETTNLQKQTVSGNHMAAFYREMNTMADQSNVKLEQIETVGKALVGTNSQFRVSGNSSTVTNFFTHMQHLPYTNAIQQGVIDVKGDQVNVSFLVLEQ